MPTTRGGDQGGGAAGRDHQTRTDRQRIETALAALAKLGYATGEFRSLYDAPTGAAGLWAFYFRTAALVAFDHDDMLQRPMMLHWQGDLEVVTRVLRAHGLRYQTHPRQYGMDTHLLLLPTQ